MNVVKAYDALSVGDSIVAIESWDGCTITQQGEITRLQYGEIVLGGEYSFEWAPEIIVIRTGTAIPGEYQAKHRKRS